MPEKKEQIYQQIYNVLDKANKILIVTHPRPDGDALGSVLAFYRFLTLGPFAQTHLLAPSSRSGGGRPEEIEAQPVQAKKDKIVRMFVDDVISNDFKFLPQVDKIENDCNLFWQHKYDSFLILDIGDFERSGVKDYLTKISYQPQIINIDHHPSESFGHYNFINPLATSTTEIMYDFFNFFQAKVDVVMATALLAGIVTDTDFFVNPNTNYQSLKIAGDLIKKGAKLNLILDNIYKQSSIKSLKLWGKALARLNVDVKNELATTAIFEDDLEDVRASSDELVGLSNFLNSLSDVKAVMVLKEDGPNTIKGSLRTTREEVDVSEIAKEYGGGGHAKAAGFKVCGRIIRGENEGWKIEKSNP